MVSSSILGLVLLVPVASFSSLPPTHFKHPPSFFSSCRNTARFAEPPPLSECDFVGGPLWRQHRVDRIQDWAADFSANLINPIFDLDNIHESYFVKDSEAVVRSVVVDTSKPPPSEPTCFVRAGPRMTTFFDPAHVTAAVVTCGGICPGLNTVIREVVSCLHNQYGVHRVWGVTGGYRGFANGPTEADQTCRHNWMELTPKVVDQIHTLGGTILGTSRGGFDVAVIVDALEAAGVNQLYVIGGDGTLRGASIIANEAKRRGLRLSVIGM